MSKNRFFTAKPVDDELKSDKFKSFDFPCTNDYCSGRNGMRIQAIAWRLENEEFYEVFCHICGNNDKFSKEDFKIKKERIKQEETEKEELIMV